MNKKRLLVTIIVVAALAGLAYLQFRTWRAFNWHVFIEQTREANVLRIVSAIAIVYATYFIRALRWSIMLRPVKAVPSSRLISPMIIGFTGLAILGRPGELIRPYLIARKERLSLSSQMAVWTVERIFDMGSFAILVALDLIFAPSLRDLPYFVQFRRAGFALFISIAALGVIAFFIWRNGRTIADRVERILSPLSHKLALSVADKIRSFGRGLHTIHDPKSFFQISGLSIALWLAIAACYLEVAHAYPGPLHRMELSHVLLLMGFSIAGSAVQLPVVGGGSQLMTIAALAHVFDIPQELSVSCGVLLWLVSFVAVTPVGLSLARREHVSIVKLSEEAEPIELARGQST